MDIVRMLPAMKEMIWGGAWLNERFGKTIPSDHTGEAWEIAAHPNGQSTAAEGPDQGKNLEELVETYKEDLVGTKVYEKFGTFFPLLIKFIDANQNLSVQVHPDDIEALELEGEGVSGKTEMWYVLDAKEGAKLVYGFNKDLTEEALADAIRTNTLEDHLNWVNVKPGDTFYIPAGTLHAIGSGILICEIQQNSDITYRVYDYGRVGLDGKPRQLHVEKAVKVVDRACAVGREYTDIDQGVKSEFFETYRINVTDTCKIPVTPERFEIVICLEGEGKINDRAIRSGDSFLIPASAGEVILSGKLTVLQTHVTL